jgi:hypothetical protein
MVKGRMKVCVFNCACLIGHVSVSLSDSLSFSLEVPTVSWSVCISPPQILVLASYFVQPPLTTQRTVPFLSFVKLALLFVICSLPPAENKQKKQS